MVQVPSSDPFELFASAMEGTGLFDEGPSRLGATGRAWYVDGKEIAHEHGDGWVDVRLPAATRKRVRADGRVRLRSGNSEWIEFRIQSVEDATELAGLLVGDYG